MQSEKIPEDGRTVEEEIKRQMRARKLKWPISLEAWKVARYDDPEFGAQVTCVDLIEAYTAHTPEQVREWGNKIKVIAANEQHHNVAVFDWTNLNEEGEPRVVAYPRKVPKHLEYVTKTTDQRIREKVQKQLHDAKVASQGVGDFDKKPDLNDYLQSLREDDPSRDV